MIEQLRLGTIQFIHTGLSNVSGVVPVSSIDSVGFAYRSEKQVMDSMDGPLGGFLRKEFAAKGIFLCSSGRSAAGRARQVTSWTHLINTAHDFVGFKLRTPTSRIVVDLFRTLGASPVPLDSNALYTALQTHVVDGEEFPIQVIAAYRLYEVQKYLSATNHIYSTLWLAANMDAWNALPGDIQETVKRNSNKYVMLERNDMHISIGSVADKLRRQGLIFNECDTASMRTKLAPYYTRCKNELGATVWSFLEAEVGKLG